MLSGGSSTKSRSGGSASTTTTTTTPTTTTTTMTPPLDAGTTTTTTITVGSKNLQERLHILLSRLSKTNDIVKDWPESEAGDDSSIHAETTTKLIASILEVISAIQRVENTIKGDNDLRKSLQDCQVPINLLDLLDHGNGLNPDCFSRGLVKEALGQLQGLKRRKKALEMLGAAVQAGLEQQDAAAAAAAVKVQTTKTATATTLTTKLSSKRKLGPDDGESNNKGGEKQSINDVSNHEEPATKRARTD